MEEGYQKELDNIERTVQNYVDGVIKFNFEQAEESWHSEGVKISFNKSNDELDIITMIQSRPKGKPSIEMVQQAEIKEINRVGRAATVLLQWYQERNGNKAIITDFISLLKMKDEWKIVAKVYDFKKLD